MLRLSAGQWRSPQPGVLLADSQSGLAASSVRHERRAASRRSLMEDVGSMEGSADIEGTELARQGACGEDLQPLDGTEIADVDYNMGRRYRYAATAGRRSDDMSLGRKRVPLRLDPQGGDL